ncbi:MAG TPA: S8 family serine peptidase [Lentimicrobium sp.]|nr:S8 family serine peptidase [Lentimicrobium sp.]
MKKSLSLVFFVLFSFFSFGQNRGNTYIIKFRDKGVSKFSLAEPRMYLSERSIERRLIQEIPLDETDLPVNPEYIRQVRDLGADVFYTSKWLNLVIVRIENQDIASFIVSLPFVHDVTHSKVLEEKKNNPLLKRFFMQEKYQKLAPPKLKSSRFGIVGFDYGPSGNQAQMLKVDQLHNQGYTGNGMVIAVMDAGFNSADQLDVFDTLFLNNKIMGTRDFVQPGNNVYSTNLSPHGTMVLSTMGGNLPGQLVGTAPHASYYLFRTEDATAEYLMEEFYWVAAAEYADSLGVDVFNTSLGYTRFDNTSENHTYEDMDGNTTPITIGADIAASKGILVVNSAGNEGTTDWHYISAPADGDSVMAVGAVDADGAYVNFSSVGPTSDGRIKPDVMAQGYYAVVASIPSGIGTASGTSFSSPILCGAATCLWQANPDFTNMEIMQAIKQSGSMASDPDNFYGGGVPDFILANSILLGNIELMNYSPDIKCYPNPFTDFVVAEFNLSSPDNTELILINSQGIVLRKIAGKDLHSGENRIKFEGLGLLSKGIYFVQISNASGKITQKIIK